MGRFLLIGGPGNISTTTVEELLEKDHTVGIFTLPESPTLGFESRVSVYRGNRDKPAQIETAVKEFKPDTVIDFVCFTPSQAESIMNVVAGKVDRFVLISTVDVYGYPLSHVPMRETDPFVEPIGDYAKMKGRCEDVVKGFADGGRLKLTICRPTYSFGVTFVLSFLNFGGGRYLVPRIRQGRPIVVPGDGTTLIHVSPSSVTGRVIATIAMHEKTIGKNYTVGLYDSYMTTDNYYRMMGRVLGFEPVLVHIPIDALNSLQRDDITWGPIYNLLRFNLAFSLDAFKNDFPDFQPRMTVDEWYRRYVEFHEKNKAIPPIDEKFIDDEVVEAWQTAVAHFRLPAKTGN